MRSWGKRLLRWKLTDLFGTLNLVALILSNGGQDRALTERALKLCGWDWKERQTDRHTLTGNYIRLHFQYFDFSILEGHLRGLWLSSYHVCCCWWSFSQTAVIDWDLQRLFLKREDIQWAEFMTVVDWNTLFVSRVRRRNEQTGCWKWKGNNNSSKHWSQPSPAEWHFCTAPKRI